MNRLRTLILTMGLLSGIIGHAHDFEIDGVFYNIISATELKVAVTYQGDDYWSQDEYSGVVTIPSAVTYKNNTYNVVNIASRAFSNCSNLITVEISQGVRSIDGWAFEYCNNLTFSLSTPLSPFFVQTNKSLALYCLLPKRIVIYP